MAVPGEVIEGIGHLTSGALIDAGFAVLAIRHHHRQRAIARKMGQVERPMACVIDLQAGGGIVVPDHARVAR